MAKFQRTPLAPKAKGEKITPVVEAALPTHAAKPLPKKTPISKFNSEFK